SRIPRRAPPKTHANTIKPIVIELMDVAPLSEINTEGQTRENPSSPDTHPSSLDPRHSFSGRRHDIHNVVSLKTRAVVGAGAVFQPADRSPQVERHRPGTIPPVSPSPK